LSKSRSDSLTDNSCTPSPPPPLPEGVACFSKSGEPINLSSSLSPRERARVQLASRRVGFQGLGWEVVSVNQPEAEACLRESYKFPAGLGIKLQRCRLALELLIGDDRDKSWSIAANLPCWVVLGFPLENFHHTLTGPHIKRHRTWNLNGWGRFYPGSRFWIFST